MGAQYENKCHWEECPVNPPSTSTSTMPPTTTTAPSTSSEPTCEVDSSMRACLAQGGSFECQKCTSDITGEPCCSCHGAVTTTETATETTSETTLTTTAETTPTTTTSSEAAGLCKPWCTSNPKRWEKKCRWTSCAGCSPCSARRLRGSDMMFL